MRPDKQPLPAQILGLLARTPMTAAQLRARTGREVDNALAKMVRAGQVQVCANDTDAMTQARVYRVRVGQGAQQ